MDKATARLLTADEEELVRRTSPAALARLDEDELVDLHDRVRRARNKYAKLHRRQAAAQVTKDRARGVAGAKNERTAQKAEVFEQALAEVSHQLAVAATQRAAELRAERLAAARPASERAQQARTRAPRASSAPKEGERGDRARKTPISRRQTASARAAGRRAQAKRDSRR
jgi:hypothetical protein